MDAMLLVTLRNKSMPAALELFTTSGNNSGAHMVLSGVLAYIIRRTLGYSMICYQELSSGGHCYNHIIPSERTGKEIKRVGILEFSSPESIRCDTTEL